MIKKSFIQSIADKNAKVNALCEYLGTLRTECIRNYQTEECANSYSEMHEIYMQVSELSAKLDTLIKENVLSDETTKTKITKVYAIWLFQLTTTESTKVHLFHILKHNLKSCFLSFIL